MIRSFLQRRVQRRGSCLGLLAFCFGALFMTGCGGLQGDHAVAPVLVSPAQAQVRAGDAQQFTAQVTGAGQQTGQIGEPPSPSGSRPRMLEPEVQERWFSQQKAEGTTGQVTWSVNG